MTAPVHMAGIRRDHPRARSVLPSTAPPKRSPAIILSQPGLKASSPRWRSGRAWPRPLRDFVPADIDVHRRLVGRPSASSAQRSWSREGRGHDVSCVPIQRGARPVVTVGGARAEVRGGFVSGQEDRPPATHADGQVDRLGGARPERDRHDFAAFAGEYQDTVVALSSRRCMGSAADSPVWSLRLPTN
jgi:hypothetical protein